MGGNGLGTLEAVLGGFLPVTAGNIYHRGEDITRLKTRALRRRGLAYVPADRLSVGSAGGADLTDNLIINRRAALSPGGVFNRGKVNAFTDGLVRRFRVAGKRENPLRSLSGGNIQKLILAREIEQFRDYIVFSEPAWGLDFSARRFVYEQIALLRAQGAAIIIISSNLDELLSAAGRIIVFYRGSCVRTIPNPAASRENETYRAARKAEIGACMLGLAPGGEPHGA
jgi:simple sugar transport system ATP-binding protein